MDPFNPDFWSVATLVNVTSRGARNNERLLAAARGLLTFPWSALVKMLQQQHSGTLVDAVIYRSVFELARFLLCAVVNPGGPAELSPPHAVEDAWRAMLLLPKAYAEVKVEAISEFAFNEMHTSHSIICRLQLCYNMSSPLIDHTPFELAIGGAAGRIARLEKARSVYTTLFSVMPPPAFWAQ
jgi:hypothetical protein